MVRFFNFISFVVVASLLSLFIINPNNTNSYAASVSLDSMTILSSKQTQVNSVLIATAITTKTLEKISKEKPQLYMQLKKYKIMLISDFETFNSIPEIKTHTIPSNVLGYCSDVGIITTKEFCLQNNDLGNILAHEIGHAVKYALKASDPTLNNKIESAYIKNIKNGLWQDTFSATTSDEYFAEGVESWFDSNQENFNQHGPINTNAELKSYDPDLYNILSSLFLKP